MSQREFDLRPGEVFHFLCDPLHAVEALDDEGEDSPGFGVAFDGALDAVHSAMELVEELGEIEFSGLGAEAVHGHLMGGAAADFVEAGVVAADLAVAEGGLLAAVSVGEGAGAEMDGHGFGSLVFEAQMKRAAPGGKSGCGPCFAL
jgi:hypothetical protein